MNHTSSATVSSETASIPSLKDSGFVKVHFRLDLAKIQCM
ncbi:hypothetical protein [Singapore grouper iridovirus]|nr:hypothetical protein [Singapore grouper iridovirus]